MFQWNLITFIFYCYVQAKVVLYLSRSILFANTKELIFSFYPSIMVYPSIISADNL